MDQNACARQRQTRMVFRQDSYPWCPRGGHGYTVGASGLLHVFLPGAKLQRLLALCIALCDGKGNVQYCEGCRGRPHRESQRLSRLHTEAPFLLGCGGDRVYHTAKRAQAERIESYATMARANP